jgi:hypothetical protein
MRPSFQDRALFAKSLAFLKRPASHKTAAVRGKMPLRNRPRRQAVEISSGRIFTPARPAVWSRQFAARVIPANGRS